MNKTFYKTIIGLLLAIILILNIVMPYIKSRNKDSQATALINYYDSIKDQSTKSQLLAQYLTANKQRAFATTASADQLNCIDLNLLALNNVLLWWTKNRSHPFPGEIILALREALDNCPEVIE